MHNIHPLHEDVWPVSPAAAARILAEQSPRPRTRYAALRHVAEKYDRYAVAVQTDEAIRHLVRAGTPEEAILRRYPIGRARFDQLRGQVSGREKWR